jgi:hypothetical protein
MHPPYRHSRESGNPDVLKRVGKKRDPRLCGDDESLLYCYTRKLDCVPLCIPKGEFNMKALLPILIIVGVVQGAPGLAQPPAVVASVSSPLLGSWALDIERSQIPPEARPKSVTITYSDVGDEKWHETVDIVGADGHRINAAGTFPLNGSAARSEGYPNVDTVAAKMSAPNVIVMAFYKEGMPRNTRTYTVAEDGRSMTETIVWLNLNGKPEITTNRFNRVK